MGLLGSTMIFQSDKTINTLEHLYHMKKYDFESYGIDPSTKVASKVNVLGLRIDEKIKIIYHVLLNSKYDVAMDRFQQAMLEDGSFSRVTALSVGQRLFAKHYYTAGNFDDEFITTNLEITHIFTDTLSNFNQEEVSTFTFDNESSNNLLVPIFLETENKIFMQPPENLEPYVDPRVDMPYTKKCTCQPQPSVLEPKAIKFICVRDCDPIT